jgi:hypothetical protein
VLPPLSLFQKDLYWFLAHLLPHCQAVPTICCGRVAAFVVVPKGILLVSSAVQKDFYWFLADGSTADATHATKPILPEFAVVSANDGRTKPILAEFAVVSANDGRTSKTVWQDLASQTWLIWSGAGCGCGRDL